MANTKISALTAATTPLDGTEVLPIVQSGATVKVANNDLRPKQVQSNATSGVMQVVGPAAAATRVMTIPDANFTAARTDAAQNFVGANTFDTTTVVIDPTNHRVGFGTSTPLGKIDSYGDGTAPAGIFRRGGAYGNIESTDASRTGRWTTGRDNAVTGNYVFALNDVLKFSIDTTGNLIPAVAAKGINFTANSAAAGMTSQLLNWYEEGTWTAAFVPVSGSITMDNSYKTGYYTRVGRLVTVGLHARFTAVSTPSGNLTVTGLPFTSNSNTQCRNAFSIAPVAISTTAKPMMAYVSNNTTSITIAGFDAASGGYVAAGGYITATSEIYITGTYYI